MTRQEKAAVLIGSLAVAGCATTQLNHNAIDLTASLDSLTTKQILNNLARTMADPYSVPSQATIAAGSATTSSSFSPQLGIPIGASKLVTDALPGADGKNSVANTYANQALTLGFSDSWQQGWTLDPATDSDQLRRLRALYRYATGQIQGQGHELEFECEYPIQTLSGRPGRSEEASALAAEYTLHCMADEGTPTAIDVQPDPNFIRWPSCVICEDRTNLPFVNKMLAYDFIKARPFDGARLLGKIGAMSLYVCGNKEVCGIDGMKAFHELRLFVFEASGQSDIETGSSKSPSVKRLGAPVLVGPDRR
jgi:hypothetical protein